MSVSKDDLRAKFASALSNMYRNEVPQYGTLLDLVSDINNRDSKEISDPVQRRMEVERHGAIRLGKPEELATMRRLFALMGMQPVGYYDLTAAGLPVHATCFRSVSPISLSKNPFRVFTSLLRMDMITDEAIRFRAENILSGRKIFTSRCLDLIKELEHQDSYSSEKAKQLLQEALETFRWHKSTAVDSDTYQTFQDAHPLVADIVCFRGPHINHLTPRVRDIEAAQVEMRRRGLCPKDNIEGPPLMKWPILLRQTSFLALEENINFSDGSETNGKHKARFGEIEQRGMALTPKGRRLYDQLMEHFNKRLGDMSSEEKATSEFASNLLHQQFSDFPDNLETICREGLAYFHYHVANPQTAAETRGDIDALIRNGTIGIEPITYEDFLPISAAGIFRSNIGSACAKSQNTGNADKDAFERGLGCHVQNEFQLYEEIQKESLAKCLEELRIMPSAV
ncbi:hypothetical protein N7509_009526 [Penicillium cosmopolitanum]|uniref:2-oxoadipate dioxygenase/decarboxylase n=1 Tax=Penicillium cosmopolitanum TaxID=1131564 RepID=A0A9W9VPQ5_9EURO|nr:uncharacterized protein N7509_009526 [Penicillium cosmopolitanum]KAJ5386985.1 hypothetical protein N7509_009526 [Penicillium cosmopolitanum]